jgi:TfoX/Sxy family transcriptional regulator of competence genes
MKNKWRKASEAMGEYLADVVADLECEPRKMFGCPCYFVNNNMFAGVHQEVIIMRLSPDDRAAIVKEHDEVGNFEPMEGRPMREYMALPETIVEDEQEFQKWMDKSYAFASSLPPKEKKKRKPRKNK